MTRTTRIVLTAGLALALAVPMSAAVAEAAPASGGSSGVTTDETTTTVRPGDSLVGIAQRFGVRLSALLRANSMTLSSVIHAGDTIVIPAGATIPATSATPTSSAATAGGSAGAAAASSHVVQPGDALAGIAWRNGVTLRALVEANDLTVTSVIFPGQTLTLPPATRPMSRATSTPTPAATPAGTSGTNAASRSSYVVQPGDALAGIAWRNGVTLGALVEANDLTVTSVIFPGQTLSLPPATRPIPVSRTTSTHASVAAPVSAPAAPAGAATTGSVDTLLAYLREQIGKPYEFFSAGPDTFDCSGLVVAGFRQVGMSVPHQSRALARRGAEIDWRTEPIVAGDLVFTSAVNDPELITHVGVALDSRTWIHAVGRGSTVSVGSLPSTERIMAVRRLPLP